MSSYARSHTHTHTHTWNTYRHTHTHVLESEMARNCCKYFTVSLVPVASVVLAVLFGLAIAVLPVLYIQLAKQYRVSSGWGGKVHFLHP